MQIGGIHQRLCQNVSGLLQSALAPNAPGATLAVPPLTRPSLRPGKLYSSLSYAMPKLIQLPLEIELAILDLLQDDKSILHACTLQTYPEFPCNIMTSGAARCPSRSVLRS